MKTISSNYMNTCTSIKLPKSIFKPFTMKESFWHSLPLTYLYNEMCLYLINYVDRVQIETVRRTIYFIMSYTLFHVHMIFSNKALCFCIKCSLAFGTALTCYTPFPPTVYDGRACHSDNGRNTKKLAETARNIRNVP